MAKFQFKCTQCGKVLEVDDTYCGKVVECPYCEKGIVVPTKPFVRNTTPRHNVSKLKFDCPWCGLTVETDKSLCGNTIICPSCEKNIVIPHDQTPRIQPTVRDTKSVIKGTEKETPHNHQVRTEQNPNDRPEKEEKQMICTMCGEMSSVPPTLSRFNKLIGWGSYHIGCLLVLSLIFFFITTLLWCIGDIDDILTHGHVRWDDDCQIRVFRFIPAISFVLVTLLFFIGMVLPRIRGVVKIVCPKCNHNTLVDLKSPMGQKIFKETHIKGKQS